MFIKVLLTLLMFTPITLVGAPQAKGLEERIRALEERLVQLESKIETSQKHKSTCPTTCTCGPECICKPCKCGQSKATPSKKKGCPDTCTCGSECTCNPCTCGQPKKQTDTAPKTKKT